MQQSSYRQHAESVHEVKKSFNCYACISEFPLQSSLTQHIENVHEMKKSFKCKVCDNHFHLQSSLKEHMISVHEKKKPYKCDICENRFSTQSSLKRHVKVIHEGRRPEQKPSKDYDNSAAKPNYSTAPGRSVDSELYILDNFCYIKKNMSSKTIYLTCSEKKNKDNDCPGYAHIDRLTNQMIMKRGHNHGPREEKIKVNELRHTILDAAGKVSNESLFQTFASNTELKKTKFGHKVLFPTMESGMRKRRGEKYPRIPKTFEDVDILMQSADEDLKKNYRGLLKVEDKPIGIILYHKELIKVMASMTELGYDGTFYVVPKPWYQLWTVHFIVQGKFFPGLSVIFDGATTEEYQAAWEYLKKLLAPKGFNPLKAKGDFEQASKKGAENTFEDMLISHCLFHYSQAIFRNCQKHGLSKQYTVNEKFRIWLKLLMSVPMLPGDLIPEAFSQLLSENIEMPTTTDRLNFSRFKRYVQRYWQRRIKPENLTCFGMEHRTSNGCECYHAKLKGGLISEGILNI